MIKSGELKAHRIYLSLGSNLGDRTQNLQAAEALIDQCLGHPDQVSRIYESAPWGFHSELNFYNRCISLPTYLEPLPLMDAILLIEKKLGRVRGRTGYADRLIDIDILFYEDLIMEHPGLMVPHPAIPSRRFVLEPLSEIAPDLIHPVIGLSIRAILAGCTDPCRVNPLDIS